MINVYTVFDGLDKVDFECYKNRTDELVVRYDDIKPLLERSDNNDYAVQPTATPKLPSFNGEKEIYVRDERYPSWTYVKWLEKKLGNFA